MWDLLPIVLAIASLSGGSFVNIAASDRMEKDGNGKIQAVIWENPRESKESRVITGEDDGEGQGITGADNREGQENVQEDAKKKEWEQEVELAGPVYEREAKAPDKVTISFAGDISFAEGYANMSHYHSSGNDITKCILPEVIEVMDSADIMMLNNEFTYSTRGAPLSGKTFTFRAMPQMAQNLSRLSVDLVSLANNHVYDYGETALLDTMDTLDQYGIPYVGAGRNLEEAKKIVYFQSGGLRIAFVSATQVERSYVFTKEATDQIPGVLRTFQPDTFQEVIRKAEETSDFVVVYVHWGTEGTNYFEGDQQLLGYQYIDAGADLVIGAHPHCLQGIEYYKGVPIVYSLGNYWFNSKTLDTGLVEADVGEDGLKELRFVPCLQQGCRTSLVTDEGQKLRVYRFLEGISANISIDGNGVIRETVTEGN